MRVSMLDVSDVFAGCFHAEPAGVNQHYFIQRLALDGQHLARFGFAPITNAHQFHKLERRKVFEKRLVQLFFFVTELNTAAFPNDDGTLDYVDGGKQKVPANDGPERSCGHEIVESNSGKARKNREQ